MQPGTGQAFTHSSHSEHTAQSMQRAAPAWASASVIGGSISSKSRGAGSEAPCAGGAARSEYECWRATTCCLSTTGSRSSKPDSAPPVSQRSIMCAARRPSPTARVMSLGPVTTSPAAKMPSTPVWRVAGSATSVPLRSVETVSAKARVSGAMPIAARTTSQSMVNSLPAIGSGRRRPEASGAPSAIFVQRSP